MAWRGRTTLRQAIRALADEGWVETKLGRGGGTVVLEARGGNGADLDRMFEQTRTGIEHKYEVRLALEPLASDLAAARAREQFRELLGRACHAEA